DVDPLDGHHRAGAATAPRARTRRAAARAPERLRRRGRTGDAVPRAGRGGGGAPCRPAGPARSAGPRAHRDGPHGERSADDGLGRRGPLVGRPRRPAGAGAVRDVLRLDPRRGRGGRGRRRGARRQRDRALPVLDADPAPDPLTRSTAAASDDKPSVVGAPSGRIDGVSDTVTAEDLRSALLADHRDAAPMMRWWWFGPAVERGELDRELTAMAEAGLGGVEVAFVYPLEQATTTFGSPDLLADLRWTAERARDLGLRFDVTLGSGWSYGGPHVTPAHAARGLRWDRREIGRGPHALRVAAGFPGDVLVAAHLAPGSAQEPVADAVPLTVTAAADGWRVDVPDGAGTRHVLLAWSRPTGQQVKRAAAGAEGTVLDHYSADATRAHLAAVADPITDAVPAELIDSVFCDSLEVYHADWTPDLPEEFERRRGYPLLPELPLLLQRGGGEA